MDYDLEELEQRYRELEEEERSRLSDFWQDITGYLKETDLDWVRQEDITEEIDKNTRGFSDAYKGFLKLFQPPTGTGGAFALYEMDYEEVERAGEEIILGDQVRKKDSNPIDEFLEGDYADQ